MFDAINSAEESICLETYIFNSDLTGRRFAEALSDRAADGIEVLVSYDAIGSFGSSQDVFDTMRKAGAHVMVFNPIRFTRLHKFTRRNHRKILVCDGWRGIAGGTNIANDYAPVDWGGRNFRDTNVEIRGPGSRELLKLFLGTWREEGGVSPANVVPKLSEQAGSCPVQVLGTKIYADRHRIRRSYLRSIRDATRSIYVANSYFVPTRSIFKALVAARRRGVDVRLLLAGKSDIPLVQWAGREFYTRLLEAGIRIYEYQQRVMHAKTATIDGLWTTIGSYNLDRMSYFRNLEVNVSIWNQEAATTMEEMFIEDLKNAKEITLKEWKRRPWSWRLKSQIAHLFRAWL